MPTRILRARVIGVVASLSILSMLAIGGALVAACGGDDIRCYAPDESACGVPNDDGGPASDASDADSAGDSRGADVGADAESGDGG
jgi:hypothetical protein